MTSQMHEMMPVSTDVAGVETWECLLCPRKCEITWPDAHRDFSRTVVTPGDTTAFHTGVKGPVVMERPVVGPPESTSN